MQAIKVRIPDNVLTQELDGEAVLLDLTDEHYFGLDSIGLRFWQLLNEHGETGAVVKALEREFDASAEILHSDLGKFIVELEQAGLLSIIEA